MALFNSAVFIDTTLTVIMAEIVVATLLASFDRLSSGNFLSQKKNRLFLRLEILFAVLFCFRIRDAF